MRGILALVLVSRVALAIPEDGLRQDIASPGPAIAYSVTAVGGGHGGDAGAPDGGFVDYGCPSAPPGVVLDGGVWLPQARADRLACLLVACETHRDELLQAQDAPPPTWVWWVAGILAAGGAGYAAGKLLK